MCMQIQVSGKQVDVGEALSSRISQELEEGVGKYFAATASAWIAGFAWPLARAW